MTDRFPAWALGGVHVACQVLRHESQLDGTVIDLMTLEPYMDGVEQVPAGTPVALRFGSRPLDDIRKLDVIMSRWAQRGTVLRVTIDQAAGGLHFRFSADDLDLLVVAAPHDPT